MGAQFEKAFVLLVIDESHYVLHTCAIVPTAVEDDDLAGSRKTLDVTLHVHQCLFAVRRGRQRDDTKHARANPLGQRLDCAALACSIAPFEYNDNFKAFGLDPFLKMTKLDLKLVKLFFIDLSLHLAAVVPVPFLLLGHGRAAPPVRFVRGFDIVSTQACLVEGGTKTPDIGGGRAGRCPLWVKSRHMQRTSACALELRKRTCAVESGISALGQ